MIRVMVVDDSSVYRMLLTRALQEFSDLEVVGAVSDGQEAVENMESLKPDVITLDMNMPRMNGMETLAVLSVKFPSIQVIVVAAETRNDAERAVSILEAGAFDVVLKPKATDSAPMQSLREKLHPVIKAAAERTRGVKRAPTFSSVKKNTVANNRHMHGFKPDIVVIGSSTGGPAALFEVLSKIDSAFPVPIVVVQHMPKLFIETLAHRLNRDVSLPSMVAEENMELQGGHIYFSPGEIHSDIICSRQKKFSIVLNDAEPEHHCKPSVDVTLRSLEKVRSDVKVLVVILTGMGSDGAIGAKLLSEKGAMVIVQDQESSVVWGMPGATVKLGAADQVLPVNKIGAEIVRAVSRRVR